MDNLLEQIYYCNKLNEGGKHPLNYLEKGQPGFIKASVALFFGGFVTFSNLYTTQPLLPIFSNEFRISASLTSLAVSLSTGILAFMMLVAASLSDRFGKKQVMEYSMILTSILAILIPFSTNFSILLFLRALLGVVAAGVPSLAMAYVADEFHPNSIGQVMGLYISGTSIGGLVGRLLTGVITDMYSWRIALLVIGVIAFILSIIFIIILPKPKQEMNRSMSTKTVFQAYRIHLKNKPLFALIVLGFFFMGSFVTLFNYIGFRLSEPPFSFSQAIIGTIFIVYLFGSFSSVYMGKKADLYGHARILTLSVLLTVLGGVLTISSSIAVIMIGISIFTFGFFACHSIASSWIGERVSFHKAHASSLYLLLYYLGSSLAGTIGGVFWSLFHWNGVICFIGVLLLISLPFIQFANHQYKEERFVS